MRSDERLNEASATHSSAQTAAPSFLIIQLAATIHNENAYVKGCSVCIFSQILLTLSISIVYISDIAD
jgi:hypothetical protein